MIKFVVVLCVIGSIAANPTCPAACPASWSPICGTDGVTYANDCTFGCAQTRDNKILKSNDGECALPVEEPEQPICACTKELRPVCGNDLKTYNNLCLLQCAQKVNKRLAKDHDGKCQNNTVQPEPTVCVCTLNYSPVCGSDGKTYSNECSLNCAAKQDRSIVKKANGQCKQETPVCVCTFIWSPVCGSDGQTYSNDCDLNCGKSTNKALVKKADGECPTERVQVVDSPVDEVVEQPDEVVVVDEPQPEEVVEQPEQPPTANCVCTRELEEFCGTDGNTYNNRCLLECAANQTKSDLKVAYRGPCQKPCTCNRNIKKVCGTDGKTYDNECLLECEAQNTRTDITVWSKGPCPARDPCVCTFIFNQVCGTDGVTYDNECVMGCEAATSKKDIRVKSRGPCEKCED